MLKIFGRNRENLTIMKCQAVRAMYQHPGNPETFEVEVKLLTDNGERLDLRLPSRAVPQLIQELSNAYEAINPPLRRGNWTAGNEGMQ